MQLRNAQKQFEEKGFGVALVGLGAPQQAEEFREEFSLPFPVICDPHKELYRRFGLKRGGVSSLISPRVILRGMRTVTRGHTPGMPQGDVMQMPGVFLIDTGGRIRYSYFSKDASDHPSTDALLALEHLLSHE